MNLFKKNKTDYAKLLCCIMKADRDAGSPLLHSIAQVVTGIRLPETPRRLITAKRIER